MTSPFANGANAAVFDAMLDLRFKGWARSRCNRLARARYAERKRIERRQKSKMAQCEGPLSYSMPE